MVTIKDEDMAALIESAETAPPRLSGDDACMLPERL
jgi:hypothetical protein